MAKLLPSDKTKRVRLTSSVVDARAPGACNSGALLRKPARSPLLRADDWQFTFDMAAYNLNRLPASRRFALRAALLRVRAPSDHALAGRPLPRRRDASALPAVDFTCSLFFGSLLVLLNQKRKRRGKLRKHLI